MKIKKPYKRLKVALYSPAWWRSWISVFIGCIIIAASFVLFFNPYQIVPGGVYGLGVVMHSIYPSVAVGTFGLMFDIPLLILAFRVFGGMFGARTVVAAITTPLLMNLMTYYIGENPATMLGGGMDLTGDVILACLFGGILLGVGVGLIIKSGATSGGMDIVAMIITRFGKLQFSRSILLVDSAVVLVGLLVFGDWRLPLYSLISIYVAARLIDYVLDGVSYDKLLFIISEHHEQIRDLILTEMDRGGTYISASGMYTGQEKDMIFVVVSRRQVTALKNRINAIDPKSFVVVVNAFETYGDGFKPFAETVQKS